MLLHFIRCHKFHYQLIDAIIWEQVSAVNMSCTAASQFHLCHFADDCCYWYSAVPGNLTCNPQGQSWSIVVECTIIVPSFVGVGVRWYRSDVEELARATRRELISVKKFDSNQSRSLIIGSSFDGLFRSGANLELDDFNSTNNGYYWCQIEVNSTCLQPSPAGHILFHSTAAANNCSNSRVGHQSNISAHTLTNLTKMTMTTTDVDDTPPDDVTTSVETTYLDTTMTTTTMETMIPPCWNGFNFENYCTISVTSAGGFLVLVFLCCLLVVLPVCVCVRRRRRRRRRIEVGSAKPASSDYKIQSTHTE